jgi:hypothetical protein
MTDDHLSAKTRRRLSRSPYAPPGVAVLRVDILARLLLERLASIGPMLESEAIDSLDNRAGVTGRGLETIEWATRRGLIRRVPGQDDEPATLVAVGAPRSLAA